MLEKRWLLRLGPPAMVAALLVVGAAALGGSPEGGFVRPSLVREVAARGELRRIAPDVAERAWLAERGDGRWVYGQAGSATTRTLPGAETGIAIGDRYVASATARPGGKSRVTLREWRTGNVAAQIDAPIWVSAAAFRGDELVITGYMDSRAAGDGGLALIEPAGGYQQLVEPGSFAPDLGTGVARGEVHVSPNGRLAATNACGQTGCLTQVVDLDRSAVASELRGDGFLRALTDDLVVFTDDDYAWISAQRIATGEEAWRVTDSILMTPLAGADGSVTGLIGSKAKGWATARIGRTGRITDLTARTQGGAWPLVWTQLSTPRTAVIGTGDFLAALSDRARATADVFDVPRAAALGRGVLILPAQ